MTAQVLPYLNNLSNQSTMLAEQWQGHPTSEPERTAELESWLAEDFLTFREMRIEWLSMLDLWTTGRIDLLAVPKLAELDVVLAFEVKRRRFDVERALKQSADYVGGRVLEGPHKGKRIVACFLYPTTELEGRGYAGVFNLIAQWRVGRGFVKGDELTLEIGLERIWRSQRGWSSVVAERMLLSKRSIGGSRRALDDDRRYELNEEIEELREC
jgi:hypothetical protein